MKHVWIICLVTSLLAACGTSSNTEGKTTTIEWLDSTFINLGSVGKDTTVQIAFHFKNTGDNNLIIEDVRPGCGCTDPEKPEEPIAPGKEGVIKAKFNSKGQAYGTHTKNITVTANTTPSNTIGLSFRVDILE